MYSKLIAQLKVSTELYHIPPIQHYIIELAKRFNFHEEKLYSLQLLFEEVFSHIVKRAFNMSPAGEIDISIYITPAEFQLRFHHLGLPYGYDFEENIEEEDLISLRLIRSLSSRYSMSQNGKRGQVVEIYFAVNTPFLKELESNEAKAVHQELPLATDDVELRQIERTEMKKLIQCLYQVFGFTYSADSVYSPEVMLRRIEENVYRGFVAVNTQGKIVAHTGMMKSSPQDTICESGMAFVSPQYTKRGIFTSLKKRLIEAAQEEGLRGVFSSAVAGHPYTQHANLKMGCIETGLEINYVPDNQKSVIEREGDVERQTVVNYFIPTTHQRPVEVYIPAQHQQIAQETYKALGLERTIIEAKEYGVERVETKLNIQHKVEWNQTHISIEVAGEDLYSELKKIINRSIVVGVQVFYASLSLKDKNIAYIVDKFEKVGFFYSGIMPYEKDDCDTIRMQYVVTDHFTPEYIIVVSDWGKRIKEYVVSEYNRVSSN